MGNSLNKDSFVKAFFVILMIVFSISSFAQKVINVDSEIITLDDVYETHGKSAKRVVLKLSRNTPASFKVKFKYHYHFTYKEIGSITVGPNGSGSINMTTSTDFFEEKETLKFDIGESSIQNGDDLDLVIEISKPSQNTHSLKVVTSLKEAKGNQISGGKVLLGLLGRKYSIKAICE